MTDLTVTPNRQVRTINLKKYGAIAAIAFPIMQMVAQGFIQVGGMEPSFAAPATEIVTFFQNRDPVLANIGGYLSLFSLVLFLWFLGMLWDELRTAEGGNGWLSLIAVGSGLITVATLFSSNGWPLAIFRIGEGLDPELARFLFDEGNIAFANIWVSLGSMVLIVGLIAISTNHFPKWLGWSSIVLAIGLFLARIVWTSSIAFAPYVFFWVWMIVLGVIFLRQNRADHTAAN
jgi:hypothetical protein